MSIVSTRLSHIECKREDKTWTYIRRRPKVNTKAPLLSFYFIFFLQPYTRSCVAKWCKNLHDDGAGVKNMKTFFFFSNPPLFHSTFCPYNIRTIIFYPQLIASIIHSMTFFFSKDHRTHFFGDDETWKITYNTFETQSTQIKEGLGAKTVWQSNLRVVRQPQKKLHFSYRQVLYRVFPQNPTLFRRESSIVREFIVFQNLKLKISECTKCQ